MMQTAMVWVVCWRRRGQIPTLPIVGPLHTGGGRPPAAWGSVPHPRQGGVGVDGEASGPGCSAAWSDAERARADANAVILAVRCVAAHAMTHHLLDE